MSRKLIAIHGLPGAGKDTFANRLIDIGGWSKVSFAAPLKRGLSTMLNIPLEDIENPNIKNIDSYKFGRSIRYMLQTLGTEWGRDLVDENIWLSLAKENIEHQFSLGMNVVNTDLRFPNEAHAVKNLGGYIIHIVRNNNIVGNMSLQTGAVNHQSNSGIPFEVVDQIVYNDGTITDLERVVESVLTRIGA